MAESVSIIDLDSKASPAILAGMLGVSVARVYQLRQTGELPSSAETSYRENFAHHFNFLRNKLKSKSIPAMEEKVIQETKNLKIKEEMMLRELAIEKQEFVSTEELYELFLPMFQIMQSSFSSIAKKFPEATKEVDDTLRTLFSLGETLTEISNKKKEDFIAFTKLELEKSAVQLLEEVEEVEEFLSEMVEE